MAVGDFNGDGRLDAAFAATSNCGGCALGSHPAILIAPGDGRGGFGRFSANPLPVRLELANGYVHISVVAVRLRHGGGLDLAVGGAGGTIRVLVENGRGRFVQGRRYRLGGPVLQLVAADLNRDGNVDLAAIVYDPATRRGHVAILLGDGRGRFAAPRAIDAADNPSALAVGDLNRDGRPDLVVAASTPPGLSVLLARRRGGYGRPRHFAVSEPSQLMAGDIAIGDVTGDRRADVIVPGWLLPGDGHGSLGAPRPIRVGGPVAVGDFNGDRRTDIAGARTETRSNGATVPLVRILLSVGRGRFMAPVDLSTIPPECCVAGMLTQTLVTDLNRDGRADLISAGRIATGSGTDFGFAAVQLNRSPASVAPAHQR